MRSKQAKALLEDPTFTDVVQSIKEQQIALFVNSTKSDTIRREDAYNMISALDEIVNELQRRVNEEKFK